MTSVICRSQLLWGVSSILELKALGGVDEAGLCRGKRLMAERCLQEYLRGFRETLGLSRTSDEVSYVSVMKDSHVLEVPENLAKKVPADFHAMAAKKGVRRYGSDELTELVAQRAARLKAVELAQLSILQTLVARFAENQRIWLQVCSWGHLSPHRLHAYSSCHLPWRSNTMGDVPSHRPLGYLAEMRRPTSSDFAGRAVKKSCAMFASIVTNLQIILKMIVSCPTTHDSPNCENCSVSSFWHVRRRFAITAVVTGCINRRCAQT
jgi:hypothetical protein